MLYLSTEIISGLGEDTFWTWFNREFPNSKFIIPTKLNDDDVFLRYSTLGFLPITGKQIAVCWELYPDMKELFNSREYDSKLNLINDTAKFSTYRTVATKHSLKDYRNYGSTFVIPIGVDTDLFKPLDNKIGLRKKYNLPEDRKIGFWIGTTHPMKGFSSLIEYSRLNPDIFWVIVWKDKLQGGNFTKGLNFYKLPQTEINELINASDFSLFTSKIYPFYIAEWEIMSTNIPVIQYPQTAREFPINYNGNRKIVFDNKWSRKQVKELWIELFNKIGVKT